MTKHTQLFNHLAGQLGLAETAKVLAGGTYYTFLPVSAEMLPAVDSSMFEEKGTWETPSFGDQEVYGESCWGSTTTYETPKMRIFGGCGYLLKEVYTSSKGETSETTSFYWAQVPTGNPPKWGVPMADYEE